jgi:arylsulfatase A-like enzyme
MLFAAPALFGCGDGKDAAGRPQHPNVLLLVMDTTRADRCSFQGYDRPTTPALAEFAKDAVVFRETWSPSNWTAPAHATLFTGAGPQRHGLTAGVRPSLRTNIATLAERFTGAGYDTACFTNNEFVSPEFGLSRGFTKFEPLYRDEKRPYPSSRATHAHAADWAEAAHGAGKPFFLFINDIEPHQPYTPPADDAAKFVRDGTTPADIADAAAYTALLGLRYDLGLEEIGAHRLAVWSDLYDAEIFTLDREIGVLLERLRKDGLLDSTVVVVLGDHGEFLGEHHIVDHGQSLYRQVLHVPMLLRYPGAFDGGRVVPEVVRLEDVAPTIVELCGLKPLPDIDGVPLTRDLKGRIAFGTQPPHDTVSRRAEREFPQADVSQISRGIRSAFDGTFHLLAFTDGSFELYDVARDPEEKEDIALRQPAETARLKALLHLPR